MSASGNLSQNPDPKQLRPLFSCFNPNQESISNAQKVCEETHADQTEENAARDANAITTQSDSIGRNGGDGKLEQITIRGKESEQFGTADKREHSKSSNASAFSFCAKNKINPAEQDFEITAGVEICVRQLCVLAGVSFFAFQETAKPSDPLVLFHLTDNALTFAVRLSELSRQGAELLRRKKRAVEIEWAESDLKTDLKTELKTVAWG